VLSKAARHRVGLAQRLRDRSSSALIDQKLLALQYFDDRAGPFPERTMARVEVIDLLAKSGLRKADVALRMGLSRKSVGRLADRFGIDFREAGPKSTAYVVDEVLTRIVGGESVRDIAYSVGRDPSSLREALRIRGVAVPGR
jgi:predicted DNA-binding protein (UPF0251 family)